MIEHPTVRQRTDAEDAFLICTHLFTAGRQVRQRQLATPEFVVTEIDRTTLLFVPALDGRFIVDRDNRLLRPLGSERSAAMADHIESLLGELAVEEDAGPFQVNGYGCRCIRISNRNARMVVNVETYCTSVSGLERTALVAERAFDAAHQPFLLPFRDDEITVSSVTRTLTADLGQTQRAELVTLRATGAMESELFGYASYPVAAT